MSGRIDGDPEWIWKVQRWEEGKKSRQNIKCKPKFWEQQSKFSLASNPRVSPTSWQIDDNRPLLAGGVLYRPQTLASYIDLSLLLFQCRKHQSPLESPQRKQAAVPEDRDAASPLGRGSRGALTDCASDILNGSKPILNRFLPSSWTTSWLTCSICFFLWGKIGFLLFQRASLKSQGGTGLCSKTSKTWEVLLRKQSEINRKIYMQDVHCSIIYERKIGNSLNPQ